MSGHTPYWRLRTFGFTPAQAAALSMGGYDIWFVPSCVVGL